MITVVTKPFEVDGYQLTSGQVVDSTTWRNESRLINCRFLREATESEVADFTKQPTPRRTKTTQHVAAAKVKPTSALKTKKNKKIKTTANRKAATTMPAAPSDHGLSI